MVATFNATQAETSFRCARLSRVGGARETGCDVRADGRDLFPGRPVRKRSLPAERRRPAFGPFTRRQGGHRRHTGRWRFSGEGALAGHPVRLETARATMASDGPRGPQATDDSSAPWSARVLGPIYRAHARSQRPSRGGPGRSVVQLERKAPGTHAVVARALRQVGTNHSGCCRRSLRKLLPK